MAITVKHLKVSTVPDAGDDTLVEPSDWNADHTLTGTIDISNGGTGQTTANAAFNALAPSQTGNTGKYLTTDGTNSSWSVNPLGTVTSVAATAGTGISVTGSPITTSGTLNITNTAPDQIVSIASGTGISATGTYPAFTVTNTAPDQTVVLTAGTGISTSGTYPNFTITNTSPSLGGDVVGPASATDNAVARFDTTTGKLIQNSVTLIDDTGNASGILSQQFSNGSAVTLAAGKMWYDGSAGSWNAGMGGGNITQQIGEELFVYGKASAAITDSPLQIIYQTGATGASGVITFAPTTAGITDGNLILGVATENIANNGFGRITSYGVVRGITTNGTAFSETWADGDEIYYNPVTGNPTNIKPVAPNVKVSVGTLIHAGAGGSGSIQVEINHGSVLGGTDANVQLNGVTNGQIISYDGGNGYWKNTDLTAGTGISISETVNGVLTVTNTSPSSGGTVTSVTGTAPVVSSGGNTPAISMPAATTSVSGYLTSTDWNTFNGKGNGTVTSVAALTLGTTGTDLSSTVATGTTTPVITLQVPTASAANRGALSSTDWSTFNGKQAALVSGTNIKTVSGTSLLGSGDVGTIGVAYGGTGTATAFTAGSLVFAGSSGVYTQNNAQLFWDNTNNRLGIGVTPTLAKLHISSSVSGEEGVYVATTGAGGSFTGVSETGPILDGTSGGLTLSNLTSTDGSSAGLNAYYYKVGGSPAAGDSIGLLRFFGESSTLVSTEYGRITTLITVATNGSQTGELRFSTYNSTALFSSMRLLDSTQALIPAVYNSTTASAANVFVASSGLLSRSTSSIKYKTQIEDLAEPNSANIYNMRPVWYRSTCATDNKDWSWYGLIAEEVAELDPRLVHWGYADDQYDISYIENDGQKEEVKTLKEDAVLQPEGVQYDRLNVLLIQEMKVLKAELESLKAEVSQLLINKSNNPT